MRRASALATASDVVVVEACKTRPILLVGVVVLFAFVDVAYTVGVFTDADVETKPPPRVITILPRRLDPDARRRMRERQRTDELGVKL